MSNKTYKIEISPAPNHKCRVDLPECRKRQEADERSKQPPRGNSSPFTIFEMNVTANVHRHTFELPSFHEAVVASNEVVAFYSDLDNCPQSDINILAIKQELPGPPKI